MLIAGPIFMIGFVPLMRGMSRVMAPLPQWGLFACIAFYVFVNAMLHTLDLGPEEKWDAQWLRALLEVGIRILLPSGLTLAVAFGLQHYLQSMSSGAMQQAQPPGSTSMIDVENHSPSATNNAPAVPLLEGSA